MALRRIIYACLYVGLCLSSGTGRAAHVYFNLQNFTAQNVSNKTFTVVPASMPSVSGGAIILQEPQTLNTGNGIFYVSNVVAGNYDCTVSTPIKPTTFRIPVPDTNGVVYAFQLYTNGLSYAILTNLYTGNVLWVDRANGNDLSAARDDLIHRFQSIGAAKSNAISGDTIIVLPGTYLEHDLMKSNIQINFMPGAGVSWTIPDSTTVTGALGIFDDRTAGAAGTFTVTGNGLFTYRNSNPYNQNTRGAVVITNALSSLNFRGQKMILASRNLVQGFAGFYLKNGTNTFIDLDECTDTGELWPNLDPEDPQNVPGTAMAVYWEQGDAHVNIRRNTMPYSYALWASVPASGTVANLWYNGQYVSTVGGGTAPSTIYLNSLAGFVNPNYRVWVTCPEIISDTTAIDSLSGGGAKLYITGSQKIQTSHASNKTILTEDTEVWVTSQKISGKAGWVSHSGAYDFHLNCPHFEDLNNVNNGIDFSGTGKFFVEGGWLAGGTNSGTLVRHAGLGSLFLKNVTVDGSLSTNLTAYPVTVSSNGLILQGSSILAGVATESIHTNNAAALRVEIQGSAWANKDVSPTLSLTNGWLHVGNGITLKGPGMNLTSNLTVGAGLVVTNWAYMASTNTANLFPIPFRLFSQTGDGIVTNQSANSENSVIGTGVGTTTIPPWIWASGVEVVYETEGNYFTPTAGAGNIGIFPRFGGNLLGIVPRQLGISGGKTAGDRWRARYVITCRTAGSSGVVDFGGEWTLITGSSPNPIAITNATLSINLTTNIGWDLTFTNANSTNSLISMRGILKAQ